MAVHSKDFHIALFMAELTPAQKNAVDRMADEIEKQGHPYLLLLIITALFYADRRRYHASGAAMIGVPALEDGELTEPVQMPENGDIARATLDRIWPEWERVLTL